MGCCVRHERGLLAYAAETTYGDGAGGTYTHGVAARMPDWGTLGREYQRAEDVRATDISQRGYPVRRAGSLKTTIDNRGITAVTAGDEYAAAGPLVGHAPSDWLLQAIGGYDHGGYGVADAGGTTTTIKLASGDGTFDGGMLVGCYDAAGNWMVGRVKSKGGVTLTLHWAMPAEPATGSKVLGGRLLYKDAPQGSLAMQWLGENLDDERLADGCVPSMLKLAFPPVDRSTLEAEFFAARMRGMVHDNEHAALAEWTDPHPYPIQGYDGGLYAIPIAAGPAYGTPIRLQGGFELDLGIEHAPIGGIHGDQPNGYAGACVLRRNIRFRATAECFRNYASGGHPANGEGTYWLDAYDNQTEFGLIGWAGAEQSCCAACVMTAVLASPPMPQNTDGRSTLLLEFEERPNKIADSGAHAAKDASVEVLWVAAAVAP
jgi:hypothetical protein